ncbi:MAG: ATP-binding protein [Thermofilaceae archaeon]
MSAVEQCRYVVVSRPPGGVSLGSEGFNRLPSVVVRRGAELFGGEVLMCSPDPCVMSGSTSVRFTSVTKYSMRRLRYNYVVEVQRDRSVERFVYPVKVWDRVAQLVESFVRGDKLQQQGFILYGPPRTGKSSLAALVSEFYGLSVVKIFPTDVFVKWVGESERRLTEKLIEAESLEPSVVLVDDCEWLLLSRELKAEEHSATLQLTLSNIIMDRLWRWNVQGRRVLFIGTTNAPKHLIDAAIASTGRLGRPIHVPLPDYEAVREFLVLEGVDEGTADLWATRVINMGLSMADVKLTILDALRKGREPEVEPEKEPGYRRYNFSPPHDPVIRRVVDEYLRNLSESYGGVGGVIRTRMERGLKTALWFRGPENVAVALATALILYYEKIPTVTLTDPRYVRSAVDAANSLRGVLVVPDSLLDTDVLVSEAQAVCFAGSSRYHTALEVPVTAKPKVSALDAARALAAIVVGLYGVEYTAKDIDDLAAVALRESEEKFLSLLDRAGYYSTKTSDLRVERLKALL